MSAWEYAVLTFDIQGQPSSRSELDAERDSSIADMGSAGWELVTVVPLVLGTAPESPKTTHERWVFKRPIDSNGLRQTAVESTESHEHADKAPLSAMKEIPNPQADKDPT